jgi:hypothetical protein
VEAFHSSSARVCERTGRYRFLPPPLRSRDGLAIRASAMMQFVAFDGATGDAMAKSGAGSHCFSF